MDSPTAAPVRRSSQAVAPVSRGPNPVYALIQTVVGLFVPLPFLWLVRPWLLPESEQLARRQTRPWLVGLSQATRFVCIPLIAVLSCVGIPVLLLCLVLPSWRRPLLFCFLGAMMMLGVALQAAMLALFGFNPSEGTPKFDPLTVGVVVAAALRGAVGVLQFLAFSLLPTDWLFFRSFPAAPEQLRPFERAMKRRIAFERAIWRLIGTLFVIGFSLLPLASLLVALPVVAPNEAVLTDTLRPARSWVSRFLRRVLAGFAGIIVLVALLASALHPTSPPPLPENGQLGTISKNVLGSSILDTSAPESFLEKAPKDLPEGKQWLTARELLDKKKSLREAANRPNQKPLEVQEARASLDEVQKEIDERAASRPVFDPMFWSSLRLQVMLNPQLGPYLAKPLWTLLPPVLVQHWPFVFLIVYGTDLLLLLLIGRVPLAYNFRYLWVRKRDTALTAVAFTVVIALVVVLLAFVNGMYKLNESTGIPGNVMVLSDGATDELFSNLAYGDASNVERVLVTEDEKGRPLPRPIPVARGVPGPDGKLIALPPDTPKGAEPPGTVALASYETYLVMNQPVPVKEGEKPRRRFLQVRAMKSPAVAAAVHNMELRPGGKWFPESGVHQETGGKYLPCVIGEGAAGTLGEDVGKPRLEAGDTFRLGDMDWIVTGVMKSEGTTFGSEVWTSVNNVVVQASGKGNRFTTLVLRMGENTEAASKAMAYHLQYRYDQAKLKAFAEPDYYKELTRTNEAFLTWIVFLAIVMAVGGVFGVMNTMFASIAARIKEVGVLRILGFKRWQILISFMLESLTIAFVGGFVGCCLGYLANGFEATSIVSGAQGGGKTVSLKMVVDYQTFAAGMLFTLIMGRLGGLVPALSAMRMDILDSLR